VRAAIARAVRAGGARSARAPGAALLLLHLSLLSACAGSTAPGSAATARPGCRDFVPPRRLGVTNVPVPDSFLAARIGGDVVDEVVVGADGAVRSVRSVRARFPELAPYAQAALQKNRFSPASIQGNSVAVRALVKTTVGVMRPARNEPTFDTVWAYVPGGEPREAQWQLRGSVSRLALVLRIENPMPQGGEVVARTPGGAERALWKVAAPTPAADESATVSTGSFFHASGDYRIELRSGGKALAFTTMTIADSYETAVVNACEAVEK
jgi:hypothetical protein